MNCVCVFGPHFSKRAAHLTVELHQAGVGGTIIASNLASTLSIPEGRFRPCTLYFAHYSVLGGDFEAWASALIGKMSISLSGIKSPSLDWWCDKRSKTVDLTMHWDECDSSTLRTAATALEDSFVRNGGRMSVKQWWQFWK